MQPFFSVARMTPPRNNKSFFAMLDSATKLSKAVEADGILVLLERATDLKRLKKKCSNHVLIVATTEESIQQAVAEPEGVLRFL